MAQGRRGTGASDVPWQDFAQAQAGVVGRAQLLALGMTPGAIDARLETHRWVRVHHGVYATFTGPLPVLGRVWAALLACGDEAALGGRSALWLWGVLEAAEPVITVCLPAHRRIVAPSGVCVVRHRDLAERVHPAAVPRRVRLEEAVLDVTDQTGEEGEVVELVLRAVASRRTSAERLRDALGRRPRHRHRGLLRELLDEAADGVQSPLERRYRRGVERAHGLPHGEANAPERVVGRTGATRTRYRDIRYRRWRVVVELDGREAHPGWLLHRDRARDNSATLAGDHVLVYGWREAVTGRCQVAVEVTRMLRRQGWRGAPRPCGPGCAVGGLMSACPTDGDHDRG